MASPRPRAIYRSRSRPVAAAHSETTGPGPRAPTGAAAPGSPSADCELPLHRSSLSPAPTSRLPAAGHIRVSCLVPTTRSSDVCPLTGLAAPGALPRSGRTLRASGLAPATVSVALIRPALPVFVPAPPDNARDRGSATSLDNIVRVAPHTPLRTKSPPYWA